MNKHPGYVNAIIFRILNKRHEILLQKKDRDYKAAPGKWVIFGGHLEQKDPSFDFRMIKELNEEIGENFFIGEIHVWKILHERTGPRYIYVFKMTRGKENQNVIALGEGAGYAFLTKKEILGNHRGLIHSHDFNLLIKYFLARKKKESIPEIKLKPIPPHP